MFDLSGLPHLVFTPLSTYLFVVLGVVFGMVTGLPPDSQKSNFWSAVAVGAVIATVLSWLL